MAMVSTTASNTTLERPDLQLPPTQDFGLEEDDLRADAGDGSLTTTSQATAELLRHHLRACGQSLLDPARMTAQWQILSSDHEFSAFRQLQSPPQLGATLRLVNGRTFLIRDAVHWISLCLMALMFCQQGDDVMAGQAIVRGRRAFRTLVVNRDPLLLTTLVLTMMTLHMYDQGDICRRIVAPLASTMVDILPTGDPVRVMVEFLLASADSAKDILRGTPFDSDSLRGVRDALTDMYTALHPHSIAAQYGYAWMLRYEGKAEQAFRQVSAALAQSSEYYGVTHMQTVLLRSLAAGCLASQPNRVTACVGLYEQVVFEASHTLGPDHPFVLEAQRRRAHEMAKLPGHSDEALQIQADVLAGRMSMLGSNHPFTIGQRHDYQRELEMVWLDQDRVWSTRPSLRRRCKEIWQMLCGCFSGF